jgi:YidC/Oxa1 family membrane protein insertase
MQKQFLLAIVLSFLVIYGWQALFPPPRKAPPTQQQQSGSAPTSALTPSAPAGAAAPGTNAPAPAIESNSSPVVSASSEQDIIVDGPAVTAIISTRGAVLKSWRLKNYRDAGGAPLELVPQVVPDAPKPFTLDVDDAATSATLRKALYKPDADGVTIGAEPKTLSFEYRDAAGLVSRKDFTFTPVHPYMLRFAASVSRNGAALNYSVNWGPALGTGVVAGGMNYAPSSQPIFYRDRKVSRVGIGDIEKHRQEQGSFGFLGVDDHYFLSAMLPTTEQVQVSYSPVVLPVPGHDRPLQFISWSVRSPAGPQAGADFFFGPKDLDVLQSIKPDLVRAIDFGMFDWLVVPLLRALKWVNSYVGNYGWSIIVLTIIINLVMFPLKHKSIVSMRKMQELQPEMKAIQDRYAKLKMTDPGRQKMNEEVMALYKRNGTNPASGCVPMLLTLPVLVAFYAMLAVAIELRGAPFLGWIKDLSAHDPYFVTPVLMGITMFVQQRMTPAVADPVQAKMMMFMPLMFTGMLMWAPSGLVLYWTASNLWAIGQQTLTNRLIGPPPQHIVRPPAERQIKNAGAGKSTLAKERK